MNTFEIIQKSRTSGGEIAAAGGSAIPLPAARCAVSVRQAVSEDLAFIDYLQKMHGHMVGWFPLKQLETNIKDGQVLIAEDHSGAAKNPVGYCIFKDQYMKRDDVGIVYQLNVLPMQQRSLIGATLVKATFERAAYGCKLFCCWCAQDIQANFFWESIGFIPLAFRTGSRSKQRVHIFWQRRIREGDEVTPYWFPSQTQNGAVREDRLVIPIPPGTHWRDAKPVVLPGGAQEAMGNGELAVGESPKHLPGGSLVKARPRNEQVIEKKSKAQIAALARSKSRHLGGVAAGKAAVITRGGVKYIDRADAPQEVPLEEVEATKKKPKRAKKPRMKNDPELVKKARELRDRFLEHVNSTMLLPPGACGKYDVSRMLSGEESLSEAMKLKIEPVKLLEAA